MEPRTRLQAWTVISQECYRIITQWFAEHPDAAPAERQHIVDTSLAHLRGHLIHDVLSEQADALTGAESWTVLPSVPRMRLAPAVWRCRADDELVSIIGLCGYSHDGRRLFLKAAHCSTGIPLHEIVRYVDDPSDPYAPVVATWEKDHGETDDSPPPYALS
jgi:hypothetical protein